MLLSLSTVDCRLLPTLDIPVDKVLHSLSNISGEVFGFNDSSIFCDATSGQWELRNGSEGQERPLQK